MEGPVGARREVVVCGIREAQLGAAAFGQWPLDVETGVEEG